MPQYDGQAAVRFFVSWLPGRGPLNLRGHMPVPCDIAPHRPPHRDYTVNYQNPGAETMLSKRVARRTCSAALTLDNLGYYYFR